MTLAVGVHLQYLHYTIYSIYTAHIYTASTASTSTCHPDVSVLTALPPDHLDSLVLSNHLFVQIHFLLARRSENILWIDISH